MTEFKRFMLYVQREEHAVKWGEMRYCLPDFMFFPDLDSALREGIAWGQNSDYDVAWMDFAEVWDLLDGPRCIAKIGKVWIGETGNWYQCPSVRITYGHHQTYYEGIASVMEAEPLGAPYS